MENLPTKNYASEINRLHGEIKDNMMDSLLKAIKIGEMLVEERQGKAHGEWGMWCENNLDFAEATARKYVRLFKRQIELPNRSGEIDLSITKALEYLSRKDTKALGDGERREGLPTINEVAYGLARSLSRSHAKLGAIIEHHEQINKHHLYMIVESIRRMIQLLEEENLNEYTLEE